MTEDEAKPYAKPIPFWMPETRAVIVAWMMVSSFFIIFLFWLKPPNAADSQLLNTLVGIYFGTGLVTAIQWWMGSAKGSDANNKMQDKLADSIQPAPQPAPLVVVVSWWSLMTPEEKKVIEEGARTDSKIKTIYEALMAGKAEPPDIAALVAAGLLTKERAANFKTS